MTHAERWWCTKIEAARRLDVTIAMVRSMVTAGQLHPVRVGGRMVIRLDEIEDILRAWGRDGDEEVVER